VLTAPRVRVELFGDAFVRGIYEAYTAPHPRFRVVARKRWGVALLPLAASQRNYLQGRSRELVRRKRRRALSQGFTFRRFAATERVDDMLAINRSALFRQGRRMEESYLDPQAVRRFCEANPALFGVFDRQDSLRAYAQVPVLGDVGSFNRLLGHADALHHGVMYLLVSEAIGVLIAAKNARGYPSWAMYDTFWGAKPGLAHFKRRLGFRPYRVDWSWVDRA
jgi:hypothetical protein